MNRSADISRNRILNLMSERDFGLLDKYLAPIELPQHFVMAQSECRIEFIYFLSSGLGSVIVVGDNGKRAEAGMFGREGFTPSAAAVGDDRSIYELTIQSAGNGHRIKLAEFRTALSASPTLTALFASYIHVFASQVAYTALSNATNHLEKRLARWLLMSHDRLDGDTIHITHDYIALLLGVRRPGVTSSLHILEGENLVKSDRGAITIRDRNGLERRAGKSYGRPEDEYERIVARGSADASTSSTLKNLLLA